MTTSGQNFSGKIVLQLTSEFPSVDSEDVKAKGIS